MTKEKQFLQLLKQQVEHWKNKTDINYSVEAESRWSEANYILTLFYSLQSDVNDNSETPNDLEKVAVYHSNSWYCSALKELNETGTGCDGIAAAFIAGAKWQKEQMMKEAVEGDIGMTLHDKRADLYVRSKGYLPESLGIKCNDKVRIIIVKED